ncbi:MAG: hypothetical protein HPZ91_07035 [Lentisphaeria bacterium]|nr:hypothetical protein [Lentisphaeria bacterium]
MKRILLFALLPLFGAALSAPARQNEMAPYLPPEREIAEKSFLSPEEVVVRLPGGTLLKPGDYVRTIDLGGEWKFNGIRLSATPFPADAELSSGFAGEQFDDSCWEKIRVPLNWYRDPRYSYGKFHNEEKPFALAWYRRSFELKPSELSGRRLLLQFDAIGYEGLVFVNGKPAGRAHGEFVPSEFDITGLARPGKNTLAVRVCSDFQAKPSTGIKNSRTYGAKWWWENVKGGIWQPVRLRIEPEIRFGKLLIAPRLDGERLDVRGVLENHTGKTQTVNFGGVVSDAERLSANGKNCEKTFPPLTLKPGRTPFRVEIPLNRPKRWAPAEPNLYYLTLYLSDGKNIMAAGTERFGFREFGTNGPEFRMNGKHIYLFGENLSSTNYGGFGRSEKEEESLIRTFMKRHLKAGVVILRTAHMPATRAVIRIADELGMMIYDEWSYCFTIPNMNEPEFEKTNLNELERFILRDFNAPSVVMWSLGNEVGHGSRPEAFRQLAKQIELTRKIDFQKRPVVPFSGVGGIAQYGSGKFDADVIDLHTYLGIVDRPWTHFKTEMDHHADAIGKIYGGKVPLITWECIGYTWGNHVNREFRAGDPDQYLKYAKRKFTWAQPHGIGYAAATGLAAMLDPERGVRHAMDRQAGRIFDLYRQDPRFQGFAGWGMPPDLPQNTRWNQPIYAALRSAPNGLPPRNLFGGDLHEWTVFLVNDSQDTLKNPKVRIALTGGNLPEQTLAEAGFPALEPGKRILRPVSVRLPAADKALPAQLRLTVLDADGNEIGRNYANITLDDPALRSAEVETSVKIAMFEAGNHAMLAEFLGAVKIPFRTIRPGEELNAFDTLLIPPATPAEELKKAAEQIRKRVENGACLVIFEQNAGPLPVYDQFLCTRDPNSLADLVVPRHPLFRGMGQERFDLWSSAPNGDVLSNMISPITDNVLAAKPPFLVRSTVGAAVLEAKSGKGRLIASQLNACANWKTESAAARYLRNLMEYAGSRPLFPDTRPLAPVTPAEYRAESESLAAIDLAPWANRSFADEMDNDGKGGWTDQGENDFRMMPKGPVRAGGIPFEIIDPEKNGGRGCLIVRGSARKQFPAAIRGIRIGGKFSRLFFLHTSGWGNAKPCGTYRFNYEDGSSADFPLNGERNIGDWWQVKQLPEAKIGFVCRNASGAEVGFFVAEWINPHPEKKIERMDFLSAIREGDGGVDWVNPDAAVPILAAVTGEKSNGVPAEIYSGRENRNSWWGMAWRGGKKPEIRVVKTGETAPAPYAVRFRLPGVENNGVPVVSTGFAPSRLPEKPRSVNFRVKADGPGVIDLVFPSKDWKSCFTATIELNEPGRWVSCRIPIREFRYTGAPFPLREGRGEFYLYNGFNQQKSYPRTGVDFELTQLVVE